MTILHLLLSLELLLLLLVLPIANPLCFLALLFLLPPLISLSKIGVSYNLANVSSYVVDLTRVKKSGSVIQGVIQDDQPLTEPSPKGSTLRRNYDRPLTTCSTQRYYPLPNAAVLLPMERILSLM